MTLEIHGTDRRVDKALMEHLERRSQSAVGRLGRRVRRIQVRLEDINGPKGGIDKRCRLVAQTQAAGNVIIEETGDDYFGVTARAMERLGQALRRKLDRLQDVWHGRAGPASRRASK